MTDLKTGIKEEVWRKNPYPENWEFMYGMNHFQLQFNYLPESLKGYIAPTDIRYRPDQRALENGDFKLAESEKHRLEEKQRAVRRYNESKGIEPKPFYFEEWKNPDDPEQVYYRYNGKYFEED
jgi:oxysterol-binding protein 1